MVMLAVVVVVVVAGVRRRDAAVAVAANQERPPVVTVVQQAGRRQQHQDERAEQEEEHVDAFSLRGQTGAAICRNTTGSQQLFNHRSLKEQFEKHVDFSYRLLQPKINK